MGEKWDYLRNFLNLLLEGVPREISSKFKSLFPSEARHLTLGEKAAIYSFVTEVLDNYIAKTKRSLIGDLLQEVDSLSI